MTASGFKSGGRGGRDKLVLSICQGDQYVTRIYGAPLSVKTIVCPNISQFFWDWFIRLESRTTPLTFPSDNAVSRQFPPWKFSTQIISNRDTPHPGRFRPNFLVGKVFCGVTVMVQNCPRGIYPGLELYGGVVPRGGNCPVRIVPGQLSGEGGLSG